MGNEGYRCLPVRVTKGLKFHNSSNRKSYSRLYGNYTIM